MHKKVGISNQSALAATAENEYQSPLSHTSPLINSNYSDEYPLGRTARLLLVLWSLFLCAGFALAYSLKPDPRGYGTHQRLGLPRCTFQALFEIPCPSCGMTTSFAHFVRAEIRQSARANIAGLLLAASCMLQIPWCWWSAIRGRMWKVSKPINTVLTFVLSIAAVALINWLLRVL